MTSLATRQEEMRRRYLPALERQEEKKRRGRPLRRGKFEALVFPAPHRRHKSAECETGYHYLECPDMECGCSCHVADQEYKGEQAQ